MRDDPELPPWARPRPRKQEARPTWVVVLALAMAVFGGIRLVSGLNQAREPMVQTPSGDHLSVQAVAAMQTIEQEMVKALRAHPVAVQVNAVSKLVTGLLLLFSVAALFTSHARARQATLAAGWATIASTLGDWFFHLTVTRQGTVAAASAWADLLASSSGTAPPSPEACVALVDVLVFFASLLCVGFGVLVLRFFGGARGRTFFGVGAEAGARS